MLALCTFAAAPSDRLIAPPAAGAADKFSAAPAAADAGAALEADGEESDPPPMMITQSIDALFGGDASAPGAGASTDARQAYIAAHSLDKIFANAVDRAMRHKVASPVEFIAHELLREVQAS